MLSSAPVPIPTKKISIKKAQNGTKYVYHILRNYRNSKGTSTNEGICIGKIDPTTGMLIPNVNYASYYSDDQGKPKTTFLENGSKAFFKISEYGNIQTLLTLADEIGLRQILEESFPSKWKLLLTNAMYMVCEGNIMMHIADWHESCHLDYFVNPTNDRRSSELFASITFEERMNFFKEWVKKTVDDEYIAYDVTSISTFSENIDIAERGHNRDNESLDQINIGMYYGQNSNIPVYYNAYQSSITDQSHLVFMLKNTDGLGLENVKFVVDRGFINEKNLKYMHDNNYKHLIPLPENRIEAKILYDKHKHEVKRYKNRCNDYNTFGISVESSLYDIPMRAHIFYNPEKASLDDKTFASKLKKLDRDIKHLEKTKTITKRFTDIFDITSRADNPTIEYSYNYAKIDSIAELFGYFIILTTDFDLSSNEILRIYKLRNIIKSSFKDMKNEIDFRRLRTHEDETTEGKLFVGFIALIIRSVIFQRISSSEETKKLTMEKVLIELKKIKVIDMYDRKIYPVISKLQRAILKVLNVSIESLN